MFHARIHFETRKGGFWKERGRRSGLNASGTKDVSNVVKISSSSFGFKPNVIASSPLSRAKETAELTKKLLGSDSNIIVDDCLYGDRKPKEVYEFFLKFKKDDKIVLVSHMPLIFELLYDLIGARSEIELLNGSIACVECDGKAAKGRGRLIWLAPPPN